MANKKRKLSEQLVSLLNSKSNHIEKIEQVARTYESVPLIYEIMMKSATDSVDDMIETYVRIYEQSCSEKLLKALIKFYKSKTGQEFLAMGQSMSALLNEAARKWSTDVLNTTADEYYKALMRKKAEVGGVDLSQFVPSLYDEITY